MPIIFILAAGSLFFFYTSPHYKTLKNSMYEQSRIVEANDKAAKLRAVRQSLTDDRKKIAQADEEKITKMLPDGVENVGLIIDIDNIASKYGMRIRNTKINSTAATKAATTAVAGPDSKKYGTIALSFSVSSAYENFLVFLKDLEASQRLVDVTSLTFTSNKEGRYEFNVTLQTYWLK
ncbi:MAG: type 4a pilus biogenesis protein PilO [Candidatus Pacebacteria bacterium]|nr:type 4a pilus biogenesis protein PilO [Candidatus Paceibacterota bacterium]